MTSAFTNYATRNVSETARRLYRRDRDQQRDYLNYIVSLKEYVECPWPISSKNDYFCC